jgi:hypothetical protein
VFLEYHDVNTNVQHSGARNFSSLNNTVKRFQIPAVVEEARISETSTNFKKLHAATSQKAVVFKILANLAA